MVSNRDLRRGRAVLVGILAAGAAAALLAFLLAWFNYLADLVLSPSGTHAIDTALFAATTIVLAGLAAGLALWPLEEAEGTQG